ncbi:conserved exported hypothetical protein [uncultured Alphaproteobacteria bacterium]|uniref:Uncharacterized protein n=1 Tax=uncultured Alphaproteobacteria bacterium TaxID=91750 RepID=A0A212K8D5_9PROT|nr:conserved exported hypothetical protein [uncultured Alphaproteobacteria bacterium]
MLLQLAIVVCIGFAAAGAALLGFRLFGRRAPKAAAIAAAGLGMLAYTQWERYTWAERTAAALPVDMTVVQTIPYDGALEFWARIWPRADALVVADRAATRTNPDLPGVLLVRTLLLARHAETLELLQYVDCAGRRRAPLLRPGAPPPADEGWIAGGEPAALYAAVCKI